MGKRKERNKSKSRKLETFQNIKYYTERRLKKEKADRKERAKQTEGVGKKREKEVGGDIR